LSVIIALFLLFVVVSAAGALASRNLLSSVLFFGAFSFFVVIVYTLLGAPDVAFTEAIIGVSVATVFFVAGLHRTREAEPPPGEENGRPAVPRWLGLAAVLFLGGALLLALRDLPRVGDPASPASTHVSPRFIERAQEETGTANFVTAVLADYRGYDTLGETVVVFGAAVAALLVLTRSPRPEGAR
jgi:multicomponent Na+:H+ antiporter subunit B